MKELIHVLGWPYQDRTGRMYIVEVHGEIVRGDLWAGTIVFRCRDGDGVRITPEETEQPSRDDLLYWATGLSTVYLDGAFDRAASRRS
jgi:hypothetical protein